MKKVLALTMTVAVVLGLATLGQTPAQVPLTWVSGTGDDVNPCSRTSPCRTYNGAIAKTVAGGTVSTLDPGSFGPVTITKSITIDGSGQIANILGAANAHGVVINAGVNDVVVLRGLAIDGANSSFDGVRIIRAGKVYVENTQIQDFLSQGIEVLPGVLGDLVRLVVRNCDIRNNTSHGILVAPTLSTANVKLAVEESQVAGNGGSGILVGNAGNSVSVTSSRLTHNTSSGVQIEQTTSTAFLHGNLIAYNGTGVTSGIAGLTPVTRLSNNMIVGNTTSGISGSGTVVGLTNNMIFGNGGSNSVNSSVIGQ